MQIIYTFNKGRLMDTIEKYIFKETQHNNQINDRDTVKYNAIFDAMVSQTAYRAHTIPLPIPKQDKLVTHHKPTGKHEQGTYYPHTTKQVSTNRICHLQC
jgi:hypothetical protein